ncbi:hypothetical protein [Lacrimispora sp. JR3]|uniref:hypothetical protein n=1 Tax=Lacrimispora sinapis TaxID=3111456 RepID=UPI00374A0679
MKKLITYTEEQVVMLKMMLNAISTSGMQNARQIVAMEQVLNSGVPAQIKEELKGSHSKAEHETEDMK